MRISGYWLRLVVPNVLKKFHLSIKHGLKIEVDLYCLKLVFKVFIRLQLGLTWVPKRKTSISLKKANDIRL